jgi:DNA-binding transcriptional LysR family regulator
MTSSVFADLGHVAITSTSRAGVLFETWLQRHGIERRVVLRTPHYMSLPAIIEATDLIATVPLALAVWFARQGNLKLLPLPVLPEVFEVQLVWHRRLSEDVRHRWLRQRLASLFADATNPLAAHWRAIEQSLYGKGLRRRRSA